MATTYPYATSVGYIPKVFNHFRKSKFPAKVTADTLKKLGFAPKNESYILNILRFLEMIDDEGKRKEPASSVFVKDDAGFAEGIAEAVEKAYSDLFEHYGEGAWDLTQDSLLTFFRESDRTSMIVGKHQVATFRNLATLAGKSEIPAPTSIPAKPSTGRLAKKSHGKTAEISSDADKTNYSNRPDLGLTVRIEINLPADGDQATYDRIFKSIRENFIDAR